MSKIVDRVLNTLLEGHVRRVFELAHDTGIDVVVMTQDPDGEVRLRSSTDDAEHIAELLTQCLVRLAENAIEAAKAQDEANRATKQ
jgi:signal transduction histidine kinase